MSANGSATCVKRWRAPSQPINGRLTPNKRLMSARFAADWRLVAALARRDPNSPLVFHRNGIAIRRWRTACRLSVSNSLSGRHWELDQVPAVGDLTDIVQLGTGHHVSAGEGQRRVALQRRVAAYLVGGGQTPDATQRCFNPGFSERIGNSRRTGSSPADARAGRHAGRLIPATGGLATRTMSGRPARNQTSLGRFVAPYGVGQTSGATPRGLNPGFSEKIGSSRRTGVERVKQGPRTYPAHAGDPLVYNGADRDAKTTIPD